MSCDTYKYVYLYLYIYKCANTPESRFWRPHSRRAFRRRTQDISQLQKLQDEQCTMLPAIA